MKIGEIKSREELIQYFRTRGFKKGAEIGVNYGLFSEYIHQTIPNLELLSVDPWIPYGMRTANARKIAMNKLSAFSGNRIIHKPSIEAVCCVPEKSLDFVYIDGEHTFDAVMIDLIEWSKRVRPGGIVSGHDFIAKYRGLRRAVKVYTHFHRRHLFLTEKQRHGADKYISYYFEAK